MAAQPRIWIAGHNGMLGSALVRRIKNKPVELVTVSHEELDLEDQAATHAWVANARLTGIIVAAARVGGILANRDRPAEFLYVNLMIATNIINAAHEASVDNLVFIASSAAYPARTKRLIEESHLLGGPLDPAHEPYAVAKIAGIKLCESYQRQYGRNYFAAMVTNLYGPNDNFDLQTSHVLPALIRKAHLAKETNAECIELWGTGTPRREFLHVDDCADALIFLLENYRDGLHINVGSGEDVTIAELAEIVCNVVGYTGRIDFDTSRPDGVARKLMSPSRLRHLGWQPSISLREGIAQTYEWFSGHHAAGRQPHERRLSI